MKSLVAPIRRRILVIDDNEAIHADFRKVLQPAESSSSFSAAKAAFLGGSAPPAPESQRPRFEVETATQGEQGVQKAHAAVAAADPYLAAFVDMRMPPGWDGLKTIQHLWQVDPELQVVICTAFSDHSLDTLADDLGHGDQLLILKKPFDGVEVLQLARALSEKRIAEQAARMKMGQLETLVRERTAEIEHATLHDKLTGLPNRTLLMSRLDTCIQRQKRHPDLHFAVLFMDFDRFKLINDSLGHEIGDLLLIGIADRLRESLRTGDTLCHTCMPSRLGGDEFIVLLEDLREVRDAGRVGQRLMSKLAEPYDVESHNLVVTASIGIATSDHSYESGADMIRDADNAMYRAKAAGRARCVMFDATMHREVMARLALEVAMRQAVRSDEIALHYQPIIRLKDGHLSGFEALVRWTHPELGRIPALELIAVAEDTGLIQPLSLNLLRRACRQLKDWQNRFPDSQELMMNVNFSPRLLVDSELVSKIAAVIQETGVDSRALALEITESSALDEKSGAMGVFKQLKNLGVWLHLDDFGTGYSSMSCLYKLPLNGLKIDRSFLREATARREHATVLQAIMQIARAFDLQVIAEGIETTEQLELLRSIGVEYGQGYIFAAPADAQTAEALLSEMPSLCFA